MPTEQRSWGKVFILVVLVALVAISGTLAVSTWLKTNEEKPITTTGGMILPDGCQEIHRTKAAVFVSCVVKGKVVYVATMTSKGVTFSNPAKL